MTNNPSLPNGSHPPATPTTMRCANRFLSRLQTPWRLPLARFLGSHSNPDGRGALAVCRAWCEAAAFFPPGSDPASHTKDDWTSYLSHLASRPPRAGTGASIAPETVRTFALQLHAVLASRGAGTAPSIPPGAAALLLRRTPRQLDARTGRPPGRPPLPDDSLVRAERADARHAQAILDSLPGAWQPALQAFFDSCMMRAKASGSMLAGARAWRKGCGFFPAGSDPLSLTAADWQRMTIAWLQQPHPRNPSRVLDRGTVAAYAGYVRTVLKFSRADGDLPKPVRRALGVSTGPLQLKGRVMNQSEFQALLEAASAERLARHPGQVAEKLALLWAVWDAGGRISEVLSLNIGGVAVSPAGGVLRMHKSPRQKRGPRDMAVTECAGALSAWLEVHPASHNLDAPLFCNLYSRHGLDRMSYKTADDLFTRWRQAAGLSIVNGRPFHWHDLRHTRATRVAKQKWDPALKNKHFGWAPGSAMGELYSHIGTEDILAQLRRDVGIDDMGFRAMMDAGDDLGALRHLLKKLLGSGLADPTHPTPAHQRR